VREIRHIRMHDQVYDEICKSLMAGQFEPGQQLSSRKLAALLGTSDMPVRTALSRLIAEGGLVRKSNATICVPRCSRRSFKEGMDLRAVVEGYATRLACSRLTEQDYKSLDRYASALEEARSTNDVRQYLDANRNLKFAIYNKCGSEMLLHTLGMLWLKVGPFLRSLSSELGQVAAANFHREAISALRRRDGAAAAAAIRKDIRAGRDLLLAHAKFGDEPPEGGPGQGVRRNAKRHLRR